MLYPTVRVREYSDGRWQFIIITDETILYITEAEAKRLFKQLEIAFRPTKRAADGGGCLSSDRAVDGIRPRYKVDYGR